MNRIIEIRPHRGGWQCREGDGVGPYWVGKTAHADATGYASERAKGAGAEIRVMDAAGNVEQSVTVG